MKRLVGIAPLVVAAFALRVALPRPAAVAHHHAGGEHAHVHAEELLPHAHPHPTDDHGHHHAHGHGDAHDHHHHHHDEHDLDAHHHHGDSHAVSHHHDEHDEPPARSPGPGWHEPVPSSHTHWQQPFQHADRPTPPVVLSAERVQRLPDAPPRRLPDAPRPAGRSRAPPVSTS